MNKRFWGIVGVIAVIVIGFVLFQGTRQPSSSTSNQTGSSAAPASVVKGVTSVAIATLDSIGAGTSNSSPHAITAPSLTENGKPEIFYEGAEYCPFCATERWAMAQALSRFGTFSNLGVTHSSTTDVYPNTQTLSFYGSSYTSQYIAFTPVEVYTNISNGAGYTSLQTPTSAQQSLVNTYDATPYLPSSEAQSIPFIDFGGMYLIAGATYSPTVLQGESANDIASSLNNPKSAIAQGVDGAANVITAAICKMTNNQPGTVCDPTIQKLETTSL